MRGLLNAALLVFDHLQFTGRSLIQSVLSTRMAEFRALLATYPEALGIWLYAEWSGKLAQIPGVTCQSGACRSTAGRFLDLFQNPILFGAGRCSLLEMVQRDFRCTVELDCRTPRVGEHANADAVIAVAQKIRNAPRPDSLLSVRSLSAAALLRFGRLDGEAESQLCFQTTPEPAYLPWGSSEDGWFRCLVAERRANDDKVTCTSAHRTTRDEPAYQQSGVVAGLRDPRCAVNPLGSGSGYSRYCGRRGSGASNPDGWICRSEGDADSSGASGSVSRSGAGSSSGDGSRGGLQSSGGGAATPADAEGDAEVERGHRALRVAKGVLASNALIRRHIGYQCARANVSCSDAGITRAISRASLATWFRPNVNPQRGANASTCTNPSGCTGQPYGAIAISVPALAGPWTDLQKTVLHELLHHVYQLLGLPWDAGRLVSPEGHPISAATAGSRHHRLIDEITSPLGPRLFFPQPGGDAIDPVPNCSAEAERLAMVFNCQMQLVETATGRTRTITQPGTPSDPRVANPNLHDDVPPADPCSSLMGSAANPRPNAGCGAVLCAEPGTCRCGPSPRAADRTSEIRNANAVDCPPDQALNRATGRCEPIGGTDPTGGGPKPGPTPPAR